MEVFTLANAAGMEARFIAYGGIIMSLRVPDRNGVLADVVPGYDSPDDYVNDGRFFGALVGRYANRIARGRFTLDGTDYTLPLTDGVNHVHGGARGFHKVVWRVAPFKRDGGTGATLCHQSAAGDQGYPGTLYARVTYTLGEDNTLTFDYSAITDAPTPVNLTQHSYVNLAGHDAGTILDHELIIDAPQFTPVDTTLIPTGELRDVAGTPFDFTAARRIGARIADDDEQLRIGNGYDHNFVLARRTPSGDQPTFAARLYEPRSGRTLEIHTTEPGIQFYSGSGLAGGAPGKGGHAYVRNSALALETQHFPDSPNHPAFPSTILRPGEEYRSRTVYRFGTA